MGHSCSTHKRIEAEKVTEEQAVHGTVGKAPLTPATLTPEEQPPPRPRSRNLEMSPPSSPGDEYPWKSSDASRPNPIMAAGRLALPAIQREEERGAEGGRASRSGGGAVDGGHGSEEVTRRRKRTNDVGGGDSEEQTTRLSKLSPEELSLTGQASCPAEESGVVRQLDFRREPVDGAAAGTVSAKDSEVMVVRPVTPDATPMLTYEDIVRERTGTDRRRSRHQDPSDSMAVLAAAVAATAGAREGEAAVEGGDGETAPPRQEARPAVAATAGAARGDAEDLFVVDYSNENELSVERTTVSLKWTESRSSNSLLNADEEDFMERLLLDD